MVEGFALILWLIGIGLAIASFLAQMQLFGIRRDVQAIRAHLAGEPVPNTPDGVYTKVKSWPSGAEIFVDGKLLGQTPFAFTLLRLPDDAERTITLKLPGFKDYEHKVRPGTTPIEIAAKLEKA